MQPHEYDFDDQLIMSSGVAANADIKSIVLENIPGSINLHQAGVDNDKQGIDWWVEMNTANHLSIDAKVRKIDWAATHPDEDDLALETWSVVEKEVIGWTRDKNKKCDYVLWLWIDTGRFCIIPFPMLCRVFIKKWQSWRSVYKTKQQFTPRFGDGYHSECVFVPRRQIWAEIYKNYGGSLRITGQ